MATNNVREIDQHGFMWWFGAWRHQAITWTNHHWYRVIRPWENSQKMLRIYIRHKCLKVVNLRLHPHLPGANELNPSDSLKLWWARNTRQNLGYSGEKAETCDQEHRVQPTTSIIKCASIVPSMASQWVLGLPSWAFVHGWPRTSLDAVQLA